MSSSDAQNSKPKAAANNPKPLWKRPVSWAVAIILAALAASLTDVIKPIITAGINQITETGDPVAFRTEVHQGAGDVTLPPDASLSGEDLAALEPMRLQGQIESLKKRGAVVAGGQTLMVTLRGNRTDPVRVTDLRDASACTGLRRGTLLRMGAPMPYEDLSLRIGLQVGDSSSEAKQWDEKSLSFRPYFPDKTITLKKGEEQVINIDLYPAAGKVCRPQVQMTVIHRDQKRIQQLVPESQQVPLMASEPAEAEPRYSRVYIGGNFCRKFVAAPPDWELVNKEVICGPGNSPPR
ncbi:hypothetical protein [Pseudarthrobacter sp. H2]|uniref:hypothetical protein n=1 Tax=Pseudarthrobacter sp. H2 TaxID=3418415 RepID=UPI003CF68263